MFEHTRAGLRDPHFGMRLYRDDAVPGTLHDVSNPDAPGSDARASAPDGKHTFWDVAFGERMPIFTWYNVNPQRSRYARGVQVNLDAGAFMLLDFDSQSSGVIDTDFRLGGSVDLRPWWDGWEHLSLSAGFFHESTHLGDEYVLSAATIQGQTTAPAANPALPYRANPSYQALPVTVSVDLPLGVTSLSGRLYGGASAYFGSALPNGAFPSEWRAGAELRWTTVDGSNANVHAPKGPRCPRAQSPACAGVPRAFIPAKVPTKLPRTTRAGIAGAEGRSPPRPRSVAKKGKYHLVAELGPATLAATTSWWPLHHPLSWWFSPPPLRAPSSTTWVVSSLHRVGGPSLLGHLGVSRERARARVLLLLVSFRPRPFRAF